MEERNREIIFSVILNCNLPIYPTNFHLLNIRQNLHVPQQKTDVISCKFAKEDIG
ncbi:MAG: hypothetical protein ACI8YQ_003779 [Polaribacter sp.]|jgi:hypothetical protein